MPTSADLVEVSIASEAVYGTIPTNPVFYKARITGEGITFAPTTTKSNEMNPKRMVTDSILTGGQVSGDLSYELAYEVWFEKLLSAAMCVPDWDVHDALHVGTTLQSFTIQKKIPVPGGTTQYHRFSGCCVNGFTVNIRPNQPITGTFTFIGKSPTIDTAELAGASYVEPALSPVMTAPKVIGIEIGGIPAISKCFNNLVLTLNNNNRGIECIGTLGPRETVLGRAEVTTQFGVLFNDSDLFQLLIDQTESSFAFQTQDSSTIGSPTGAYWYRWFMPRMKLTADAIVAGGTNQDVVNAVTAEALLPTSSGSPLESVGALVITRYHR